MPSPHQNLPGRSCGSCSLCCRLPDIEEFSKPANDWCGFCVPGQGCRIYETRPQLCRDFFCLYMTDPEMPDHWVPALSHMMVYRQGPQLTVLVDPDHADIWTTEPYFGDLRRFAARSEKEGGYVILYVGDTPVKIEA